ncbi:transposase, partial [Bacillus thuringiensis]
FLQFCHFANVFIALSFTIFFGKHSELRERALQDQLPRTKNM